MTTGCLYVYIYVSIRQHTSELKRMYTYRYDDGLPGFGLRPLAMQELRASSSIRAFWREAFAFADMRKSRCSVSLLS